GADEKVVGDQIISVTDCKIRARRIEELKRREHVVAPFLMEKISNKNFILPDISGSPYATESVFIAGTQHFGVRQAQICE
ncbi:MAG TPA: hypothetical protein PLA88_11755, partial [Bacteroidales bacterium]|nr:hypothetical protein [Bacteroidales bacterium]